MTTTVAACSECGTPMVSQRQWRNGVRPSGSRPHVGRGLCVRCDRRKFLGCGQPRRDAVDREAIAEDWEALSDPFVPDRINIINLAPRLGVSRGQLEKIVAELRKSGRIKSSTGQPGRASA